MDVIQSNRFSTDSKPVNWNRRDIAARLAMVKFLADSGHSQQQCARQVDVPRSTLQNWMQNRSDLEQQGPFSTPAVQFFRITPRARVPT
jgi:transposase-like protein